MKTLNKEERVIRFQYAEETDAEYTTETKGDETNP